MTTSVLILASGEQSRWEEETQRKQLIDVGDETVIARIVRQCRGRGIEPWVVTHHPDIARATTAFVAKVSPRRWTVETLLSTKRLWCDRTIVLLGDVVYSKALMDRIFDCDATLKVFGNGFEIFALVFHISGTHRIRGSLGMAIAHAKRGAQGSGKLRRFYQFYCGLDTSGNEMEKKVLAFVDPNTDYTTDLDSPDYYKAFVKNVIDKGRLDDN